MRWSAARFVFPVPGVPALDSSAGWQQWPQDSDGTGFDHETARPSIDSSANPKAKALSRCHMKCVPTLQYPQSGASRIRKINAAEKTVPAATSSRGIGPRPASGTANATPKVAINPGA